MAYHEGHYNKGLDATFIFSMLFFSAFLWPKITLEITTLTAVLTITSKVNNYFRNQPIEYPIRSKMKAAHGSNMERR
jgi:hypothetical protein